jgi:Beta protein
MTTVFPALKLKSGEIEALLESERDVINSTTPIFDVARPSSKTPIEKRLGDSLDLLRKAWPKISREFYLDLRDLPLEARLGNGAHPAYHVASQLAYHGYKAVHCFGFDRDDAYETAIAKIVNEIPGTRLALRLEQQDLKLLDTAEDLARGFLNRMGRHFENTTVFLDLQSIHKSTDDLAALVERSYLRFKNLGAKNIIFLASAMWDWSLIKPEKITRIPRRDIALWQQLRNKGLLLGYGDYGVVAPSFIDPEKTIIPAPKFRYTTPTDWLVAKGEKPRKDENSQYPRLAQRLMKMDDFRVNDLGWGHEQIRALASYEVSTIGNSRAVAIDTCTHLNVITSQIAFTERQLIETESNLIDIGR